MEPEYKYINSLIEKWDIYSLEKEAEVVTSILKDLHKSLNQNLIPDKKKIENNLELNEKILKYIENNIRLIEYQLPKQSNSYQ